MIKTRNIGVLNEGALHAALKAHYVGADGQVEVSLGDFVADVVCDGAVSYTHLTLPTILLV